VDGIGVNRFCEKIADGAGLSLCRVCIADEFAEILNGIFFFENILPGHYKKGALYECHKTALHASE
jgi:hypothetical protein